MKATAHRIDAALGELLPDVPSALTVAPTVERFTGDLEQYAELIVHPTAEVAGFMTRGEDAGFTERAAAMLEQISPAGAAHHQALARWFQHRRAFFKIEWHRVDDRLEPLAACYFRRRPHIDDALLRLSVAGVDDRICARVAAVADALDKETVHFVSAAFRPAHPVRHKLYFSQYVTPETRKAVAGRVEGLFDRFELSDALRERWRAQHGRCVPGVGDSTIYVSVSFEAERMLPSFKIDYPGVPATRAAWWVDAADRAAMLDAADRACALAGTRDISYLGVRFEQGRDVPTVKLYCDPPR